MKYQNCWVVEVGNDCLNLTSMSSPDLASLYFLFYFFLFLPAKSLSENPRDIV